MLLIAAVQWSFLALRDLSNPSPEWSLTGALRTLAETDAEWLGRF